MQSPCRLSTDSWVFLWLAVVGTALLSGPLNAEQSRTEDYSSTQTGYACEGSMLTIECANETRIEILRANYGRFTLSLCNDGRNTNGWDTQCMSTKSLGVVSRLCAGKRTCSVRATNARFGDPCSTTLKYLEIEYTCSQPVAEPRLTSLSTPDLRSPELVVASSTSKPTPPSTVPTSTLTTTTKTTTTTTTSSSSSAVRTSSSYGVRLTPGSTPVPVTSSSEPPPQPVVTPDAFCDATRSRDVDWPRTRPGVKVFMECPNNKEAKEAFWYCSTYPVAWAGRPDLSQCVSPTVLNIQEMLQDSDESFEQMINDAANDLVTFTEMEEVVYGGDIANMMLAMQDVVEQIEEHVHDLDISPETKKLTNKVNDAVLRTGSYLLEDNQTKSWEDLPQATQAETATRLLSTVENSAYQVARTCSQPMVQVNITVNIVVEVNIVDVRGRKKVNDVSFPNHDLLKNHGWNSGGDSIRLTGETIKELGVDGIAKIIFATYSNIEQYLHMQRDDSNSFEELKARPTEWRTFTPVPDRVVTEYYINDGAQKPVYKDKNFDNPEKKVVGTKVISASVGNRSSEVIPLKEPVVYTLEHKSDINVYDPSCAFWEYSEKTMNGKWSTFGCELVETNVTHTTCSCQHLTNFAVLMSVAPLKASAAHEFTLALMTYFGCILSIVCLVGAFFTFQCFKNLQCDRNTIHKNLVVSLMFAETVFLVGIAQYDKPLVCSVIAGVLHYLFLAAFAWMCLEGIQLYVMLVEVFEVEKSRVGWYYAAGYGIPAIIVAVSAAIFPGGYGTPSHCWLRIDRGFIWAFVGPVCAIICVNLVMLSIAMYIMCRHASSAASSWKMKEKGKLENIQSWIKGALVLIVLLGPTWAFGLLYINSQWIVMAYVFTVLNSLQGVFIFVFHCLMNDKTLKEYKRWVRHTSWLPDNLRTRCGATKATTPSTTPNNSSSSGVNRIMTEQKLSLEYLTRLLNNRRRKRSSTTSLPTSTNTVKRGYNRMQRNSSGRDSAQLTDSGIACCNNDESHIYSEPTTEDPAAYLDPIRIRLAADEDQYWAGGELSLTEGSVADTEYLDNFGRRGQSASNIEAINVDKYKIRPPPPSLPLPLIPSQTNQIPANEVKTGQTSLRAPLAVQPQLSSSSEHDVYSSDESLVRRKLLAMGEALDVEVPSSVHSSASTLMNNLNKCSSDGSLSDLSAPNIAPSPPPSGNNGQVNLAAALPFQRSLASAGDAETRSLGTGERKPRNNPVYASIGGDLDTLSRKSKP